MKHLILVLLILVTLTAAQNMKVEQLLSKTNQYQTLSQQKNQIEEGVADPQYWTNDFEDELDEGYYTNQAQVSTTNSTYTTNNTNSSSYNNTDTNPTYSNYTDTNSTYQNQTDDMNTRKQRLQQKIHLKLRKQLNLSGVHNYTQNVSYYNPYRQQYEYIVLFNESNTVNINRPNEYYFYQNNTLITLQREYDYYGNIVYRNITLDYNLVVQSQSDSHQYGQNMNVFGTLVIGNGNVNGTYYNNGFIYYSKSNGQGISQFGNHQNQSNIDFAYNNGSVYIDGNRNNDGYDSQYNNTYQYNGNVSQSNELYNADSYNNQQQFQASYDKVYNYSSLYTNDTHYTSDYQVNTSEVYANNFTYDVDQIQSNSQSYSKSLNYQSSDNYKQNSKTTDYNSEQQNQQSNTLWTNNYNIGNKTNFNTDFSSSQYERNYVSGDYADNSNGYNYQINYNDQTQKFAGNQTNQYNETDNYISNAQGNSNQYNYKYQNESYYQYANSQAQNVNNRTHEVIVQDNTTKTTNATLDGSQYNYNSYQYGNEDPVQTTTQSKTHNDYYEQTTVQQFNQLRGSKKATGSWKQVDVQELLSSNSQIVEQAIKQVNEQYQPNKEGFEFNSVINVNEQIVAGINYAINLQFINAEGDSRIYQVIIYSAPWTNKPDQVISCQRVFEQDQ